MNSQDKIVKITEVVAYARVSSREQAENSAALDQQIARLKAAGAEIVLIDTESGREGKEIYQTYRVCVRSTYIEWFSESHVAANSDEY
ncbi:MAG: hypothetical protein KAF91_20130 [Nostoc sp. TH1S01]|nr:hypothetical protein [Nostoc sp. TH1S01]